jgi:predicted acylesterase/phospholipase RssA
MAAASKWKMYEIAKEQISTGVMDLDTNAFRINLYLSTSNANTLTKATINDMGDISNQVATNYGYTQDTKAVTITVAESGGTVTVDETTNPVWTAAGGSITARFAVIYKYVDGTPANNIPLAVCLLDTAPADVTATTGNTFTITQNASGIFTITGGAVD